MAILENTDWIDDEEAALAAAVALVLGLQDGEEQEEDVQRQEDPHVWLPSTCMCIYSTKKLF